jgi:hypothetical protein
LIDPAELHRVFPATGAAGGDTVALQRLIPEQAETIRDLRHRLDAAAEERRVERQHEAEERRRLLALLTGPRLP